MPCDTLAPYSWPHSVSWCLAEGYKKRRSGPPHGPVWLGKDVTVTFYLSASRASVTVLLAVV